jgi:hypothetical protein
VGVPDRDAVAGHGPPALPEGGRDDVIGFVGVVVVEIGQAP